MIKIASVVHILAAIVWLGGMFFAYVVLRPALGTIDHKLRFSIWIKTLKLFFHLGLDLHYRPACNWFRDDQPDGRVHCNWLAHIHNDGIRHPDDGDIQIHIFRSFQAPVPWRRGGEVGSRRIRPWHYPAAGGSQSCTGPGYRTGRNSSPWTSVTPGLHKRLTPCRSWCAGLLCFSVLLYCWITFSPGTARAQGDMPSEAPLFTLFDSSENLVALEDYRGKVVLINFWATWCPPCIEEMPALQGLKESFIHRPFEILAINMAENQDAIDTFLERTGFEFSFPLLLDPGGKVADQYHVTGLPTTMLVDLDGMFAFGGVGPRDWNSSEVQAEILPLFE